MSKSYRSHEPVRYQQPSPSRSVHPSNYPVDDYPMKNRPPSANVNIVVTQPGRSVWDYEHHWSTELCSCCSNCKQCCYAFFCSCCFECKLYKRAGENMCTCMCPGSRYALRSKIRTAFRIQGSAIEDCCVATCCPCCTTIQLTRELHYQGL